MYIRSICTYIHLLNKETKKHTLDRAMDRMATDRAGKQTKQHSGYISVFICIVYICTPVIYLCLYV